MTYTKEQRLEILAKAKEILGHKESSSEKPLNQAELQVRQEFERRRPAMDAATQDLWNSWCNDLIQRALVQHTQRQDQLEHRLLDDITDSRDMMFRDLLNDLIRAFTPGMNQMRDDVVAVLRNDVRMEIEKCLQSTSND
jgi:hypothetical protein